MSESERSSTTPDSDTTTPTSSITISDKEIVIHDPDRYIQEKVEKHRKGGRPTDEVRLAQGKRDIKPRKGWWPEEKKIEVATMQQAGMHKLDDLSRISGVPANTIKNWMQSEEWYEIVDRINTEKDVTVVSKFNQIMDQALEVIQDRLINGDFAVLKSGDVVRKPVSLRDATVAGAIIVDKRQLLRGKATSRTERVGVEDRLGKLAEDFKRFVEAKEVTPDKE